MKLTKILVLGLLIFCSLFLFGSSKSQEDPVYEIKIIEDTEVLYEDCHFAGSYFENKGTIDGSLFVATEEGVVNGVVNGNTFIAGQDVLIAGNIKGDLYVAGNNVIISGNVEGSIYVAAGKVVLDSSAEVARSLYTIGGNIFIYGAVDRNVLVLGASNLIVKGLISGDLKYNSQNSNIVPGSVKGTVYETNVPKDADRMLQQTSSKIFSTLSYIFSSMIIWLLLTFVFKKTREKASLLLHKDIIKVFFLYGLLGIIGAFMISTVLLLSFIGMPFGLILLFMTISALYLSSGVFIVTIADYLGKKFSKLSIGNNIVIVIILAIVISIIKAIPFIAGIVTFIIAVTGFGLMLGGFLMKPADDGESKFIL